MYDEKLVYRQIRTVKRKINKKKTKNFNSGNLMYVLFILLHAFIHCCCDCANRLIDIVNMTYNALYILTNVLFCLISLCMCVCFIFHCSGRVNENNHCRFCLFVCSYFFIVLYFFSSCCTKV